jgi:hypothetical protein
MESEIPESMEVTQKLIHAAGYNVGANSYTDIALNIPTECESQDTHDSSVGRRKRGVKMQTKMMTMRMMVMIIMMLNLSL